MIRTLYARLEDQEYKFFHNGMHALEKRWNMCNVYMLREAMFTSVKIWQTSVVANCERSL